MSAVGFPSDDVVPLRRLEIEWVELDGEVVVYDVQADHVHRLNPSAASVWAACDGSATVAEIVGAMQKTHAGSDGLIAHDVFDALARLREVGLVELPPTAQGTGGSTPG